MDSIPHFTNFPAAKGIVLNTEEDSLKVGKVSYNKELFQF